MERPAPVVTQLDNQGNTNTSEDDPRRLRQQSRRRSRNAGESAPRPYFERVQDEGSSVNFRRVEAELEDSKRIAEDSKRRLAALLYMNNDLEQRLEREALVRLDLEREIESLKNASASREKELASVIESLEQKLEAKTVHENKLGDQLLRLERELYRMHQKKHEIVKEIRRQEAQERADGASTIEILRAQTGKQVSATTQEQLEHRAKTELQDEAMAVAYFSQPTSDLAVEQGRFRVAQSLGEFLGISEKS